EPGALRADRRGEGHGAPGRLREARRARTTPRRARGGVMLAPASPGSPGYLVRRVGALRRVPRPPRPSRALPRDRDEPVLLNCQSPGPFIHGYSGAQLPTLTNWNHEARTVRTENQVATGRK